MPSATKGDNPLWKPYFFPTRSSPERNKSLQKSLFLRRQNKKTYFSFDGIVEKSLIGCVSKFKDFVEFSIKSDFL